MNQAQCASQTTVFNQTAAREALLVLAASLFMALMAQLSVRLPFTPVPVTMQTLAVYLVAAALGPRKAALAVLAYLAEGFSGLPVFAPGSYGFAALLGPTGGYLLGFLPAAMLSGLLLEKLPKTKLAALAAFTSAALVIYAAGLARLWAIVPTGMLLSAGLLPFLAGEAFKIALASATAAGIARVAGK